MNNDEFKWIKFYTEFADILLNYENNPNLLKMIQDIFKKINTNLPKKKHLKIPQVEAIDPFVIFALFNRKISDENRFNIVKGIKDTFHIYSEIPDHFGGIPISMNAPLQEYMDSVSKDSTRKIWKLFKLAIYYSKNNNVKEEFINTYNEVLKIKNISWNLTMFLYWIRPYTFINLDSTNKTFLMDNRFMDSNINSRIQSLKKVPDGKEYLEICEECNNVLNNCIYTYSTFPQLSLAAYELYADNTFSSKNNFIEYLKCKKYMFDERLLENFLLSLKVKPFVILTGNSGTGKTKLAQLFAQYLQKKLDYDNNYELLAVGANWTDNRNIIGFKNVITGEYHETHTCKLIKEANKEYNKDKPYFLILDEMNLSHVERYFTDFLSSLESGEEIKKPGTKDSFKLPENLFVVGTVNVDETTYMFSPKVLDRANVLEFKTASVDKYMNMDFDSVIKNNIDIEYLENPLSHKSFLKEKRIDINDLKEKYPEELWNELKNHLTKIHKILAKSGFDFGFRVTNEILSFILEAYYYENKSYRFDWKRYFDAQILQKLLPKLHGSRNVLEKTLLDLEEYCTKEGFGLSASKLREMNEDLETLRYVSFIN